MMISPKSYAEEYLKGKSLDELVQERNELLEYIYDYEENFLFKSDDELDKLDLDIKYYYNNLYLIEVSKLIIEKLKNK